MKKYLFRFLTLALIVPALASCAGQLEDNLPLAKKHTVYFSTVVDGQATRTGLAIDGNNVVPDWRSTDPEDVHLFEMNGTENALLGKAESVNLDDNDLVAHFKADFEEEITIIVTPPSNPDPDGDGAKVLRQGSNTYGAVVAKSKEVEGKPVFYIPAVQTPDAETLKDPGAEFLVGYSRDGYDAITLDEEGTIVDLYFDRVAALSRIGFTNFSGEGERVISVKINSQGSMTGSVKSSDISFGNSNSVTWTPDTGEGANVLTLSYGDAGVDVPAEGAFYAYFVSMPGRFNITSIEVLTDQYHYTKTVGREVVFDLTSLKNLTADLSNAEAEELASNVWYKVSKLEAGYDYVLVSANNAMLVDGTSFNAVPVTANEDGSIQIDAAVTLWTVAEHVEYYTGTTPAGHYTLKNGDVYLQRNSDGAGTNSVAVGGVPTNGKYYVWEYDGEHLYHLTLGGNSVYNYFLNYNSGWVFSSSTSISSSSPTTYFYTKRAPQEPGFDPTGPFTFDIDQLDENPDANFSNEPELINYYGDVTYSSSNESIATVDPASGDVTILKAGTVEIIATVAGDATHQAATASYLINITTSKIPTWYKADEIVAGETYLVVSHDYALDNDGSSGGKAVLLEGVSDIIQYDAPETMIWTATNESSGKFRLTGSDGKVIRLSSSSFQIGSASQTESNNQWSLNADGKLVNGNYYLYYSTSQSKWAVSNSASDTHSGYLYSSNPGRAPRNLSFGEDPVTVTHDLANGTDVAEPTLTGDKIDDVTYAVTSDPKGVIASINPTTGAITLASGKTGTAVITASADRTDSFKAESITYTLIVKDSSIPVNTYVKVTSTSDLEVGTQYLLVYEGGGTGDDADPKVFVPTLASNGNSFNKQKSDAIDVVITNSTITSNDYIDGHLTLETGYFLKVDAVGKYLYPTGSSSGSGSLPAESTASNALNITFNNGIASITPKTGNYTTYSLAWSTYSHYFSSSSGTNSTGICLYKLEDNRPAWTMSYSPMAATYDLYTKEWTPGTPALTSDATTTLTYTSSDESVATVDANGVVTPLKKGTATISAAAAADATHKRTVASYELTVEDSSPAKMYVRVESTADLTAGEGYLIVYENGSSSKVFKPIVDNTTVTESANNAIDASISEKTIMGNTSIDECQVVLVAAESNYFIKAGNYYIYPGQSNLQAESTPTDSRAIAITISGGRATIKRSQYTHYLIYNAYFRRGGSDTNNLALYKLDDGSPKNQNLKFSSTAVSYNMASSSAFSAPTLSGAKTSPVTYDSSNTSVATVTSDGEVSIVGVGVTTITANAPAGTVNGTEYKAGSASYTLTVKNEAVVYYTKVNSRDDLPGSSQTSATGNYIFVYESGNKAYVFKAICDGTPTGSGSSSSGHVELTKDGSAIEVALTDNGIEATDAVNACQLQLAHHSTATRNDWNIKPVSLGTYWIRVYNDGSSVKILAMTSAGYSGTFTFEGSGNNLEVKRTDSSRNAYWSYNATNNCFEATSTASKISIYKLEDSSNP